MQTVTFNPLPAGARALTVDETAVVAGGNPLARLIVGFILGRMSRGRSGSSSSSSCSCSCECSSETQESQQEPDSTCEP